MFKRSLHSEHKAGFTLLELMLVVVILSAVAFMITGSVSDNISQVRYEDTRNRLDAIRTAVLGPSSPALWDKGIQSGYVVDNGILPANIDALVVLPDDGSEVNFYDEFGVVYPVYDQGGADEFEFSTLTNPANYQLMKGHRGSYLPKSTEGKFRDGWGNVSEADDEANHGWGVMPSSGGLSVESYGMDGQTGELTGDIYEASVIMSPEIVSADWRVPVNGRSVTVVNKSGSDIEMTELQNFSAALLVYTNDGNGDGPNWTTISTSSTAETSITSGDDFPLTFSTTEQIPVGEHLLVLLHEDSGAETPDLSGVADWPATSQYVTKRVKFFPRGGVPDMVLEIR